MSDSFSNQDHSCSRSCIVLDSTLAGSWYPGESKQLRSTIRAALESVPEPPACATTKNILLLPHAGYAYSLPTAAHGIRHIQGQSFKRVLLLAPSHRAWLPNQLAAPAAGAVRTPFGEIALDKDGIRELARRFPLLLSDSIHQQEHSAQIQYPLLQFALRDFCLLPLIVGSLDSTSLAQAAEAVAPLWDDNTLLLISTDFTHYGKDFQFSPFASDAEEAVRQLDLEAFAFLQRQDRQGFMDYLESSGATICGQYPLALMLSLLKGDAGLSLLHYSNSLDGQAVAENFVCYLAAAGRDERSKAAHREDRLPEEERKLLLSFARRAIEYALQHRRPCPAKHFAAEATALNKKEMACFVTLNTRSTGRLRGCIGEIEAFRPLYQAVTARAVDAAFRDPRFMPLEKNELSGLCIEISVLTAPEEVASWRDICIGKHGMTLLFEGRSAVFLPQVAPEQGWDLPTTLTELSLKAGLPSDTWRNPKAKFTVFEAIVFSEDCLDGHG